MSYNIPTPKGWQLVKLSDLGEVNRGKSKHRPRDADFLYGGKYPFIQTGDVKASGGRINSFNQTYSDEGLKQSRLWPEETMCITIAANIAETGVLQFPACFPDSVIGFIADKTKCDVYFIEYMFRLLKAKIKSQANGSVQDNINLQTLERILFPIPNLADQKKIAKILGVFDDKIIINNRLIETLEQMAQALFKSWFVDFEPVKAKMAVLEVGGSQEDATFAAMTAISGKDADALAVFEREHPEHYAELKATAELFPSVMQDSELGEIPGGWMVNPASAHYNISIGKTPPRKEAQWFSTTDGDLKWVSIKDMGIAATYISETSERLTHEAVKKFNIKVMPADTVFLSFKLTVGRVCITTEDMCSNEAIAHFIPKGNKYKSHWLYHALNSFDFNKLGSTSSIATAVNSKTIRDMKLIFPNELISQKYTEKVSSLMQLQKLNAGQTNNLTLLRDTLLPKLLSGEITLPEAEQAVSEAENV